MSTRGTKRKLQEDEDQQERKVNKKQKGKPSNRKRKHYEEGEDGKGEKKQKTDNWPTVDELLARWHSNQFRTREDIHGYQTTTAEYVGPGYYWQYNRDLPEDHKDYKRWIDPERRLVECKIPQRHANKQRFELVMGVGTAFSRKFCMDVFMYFTPRERLTMLMKFWRVWRDHFKNEKLPWRWVIAEVSTWQSLALYFPNMINQVKASPYLVLSHSVFEIYRAIKPRCRYSASFSGTTMFYWFSYCLDEDDECEHFSCERALRLLKT
jgi:hypothetical protein